MYCREESIIQKGAAMDIWPWKVQGTKLTIITLTVGSKWSLTFKCQSLLKANGKDEIQEVLWIYNIRKVILNTGGTLMISKDKLCDIKMCLTHLSLSPPRPLMSLSDRSLFCSHRTIESSRSFFSFCFFVNSSFRAWSLSVTYKKKFWICT